MDMTPEEERVLVEQVLANTEAIQKIQELLKQMNVVFIEIQKILK